jgi:2-amino-4-hydroxy-6-hydroxymethyldihydropteridine diphosphokinase
MPKISDAVYNIKASPMLSRVYMIIIALGSNLAGPFGTPDATVRRALDELNARGVEMASMSRLYRTAAHASTPQPDFVNAIATVYTPMAAGALLKILKRIEAQSGRRAAKNVDPTVLNWAPRTLDLDLICYKGLVCNWKMQAPAKTRCVILPHPRAHERAFVLQPLMEVAPFWHHPIFGLTAAQLLKHPGVKDTGAILSAGERLG